MQRQPARVRRGNGFAAQPGIGAHQAPLAGVPARLLQHVQGHARCAVERCQLISLGVFEHGVRRRFTEPGAITLQPAHTRVHRFGAGIDTVKNRRFALASIVGQLLAEFQRARLAHPRRLGAEQFHALGLIQGLQNTLGQFAAQDMLTADLDGRANARTPGAIFDRFGRQRRAVDDFQRPPLGPPGHFHNQGQCIQVQLINGLGALQLLDHGGSGGVRLEQAHRFQQLGRRDRALNVHLAQGVVADTADIRQREQRLVSEAFGGMPDTP